MRLNFGLILLVPIALSACGHQLDSPPPSTSAIMPNVVCNAQLTKQIVVSGMNLTPLPTKTLGHELLNLPTVTLTESSALDGSAGSGQTIPIADDPNNPGASHVRWESEEQLGFDFTPDLNAPAGLYDVTVTNPDGKSATLPGTLAVVPPPMVGAVMPPNICDAQGDQTITVTGADFLQVGDTLPTVEILDASGMPVYTVTPTLTGCQMVPGDRTPPLELCTGLSFVIPLGAVAPGNYTLRVTNPPSAECQSTESVPFVIEPPPHIDSVLPSHICAGGGTLDVKGTGFLAGAQVSLDDPTNMMSTVASAVSVSTDGTSANAMFGAVNGAPGDSLDLTLKNADGCSDTLKGAVTVVPGPIIFYVDPPVVYGGITTPVTVYTTGITGPLPSSGAVVLTPNGATTPAIDLTASSAIDVNHPKHVIVSIPPTVPAGVYDLTLNDASGCPAVYAKAITVVTQKTNLKDILPPFGWDSAATSVTIDATAAFFQPGARAYLAPHAGGAVLATPLSAVTYQSPTQLTAVVPGSPAAKLTDGLYDLVTVNPNGTIGFLDSAFTIEPTAPPVITSISPGGVVYTVSTDVTLAGENFATASGSTPPPVTLDCLIAGTNMHMTIVPTYVSGTSTRIVINIPAGTFAGGGTVCVPTVNNSVGNDMYATGGSIAIFNGSFNVDSVATGSLLTTARRAPAVAVNGPTLSARYVYAIGGDTGALGGNSLPNAPIGTVEYALRDPFTGEGSWAVLPAQSDLPGGGITLAGVASVGRFIYLVGGYASGSLNSVWRSEVLDPADAPQIDDADLTPDATNGLAPGLYYYRVAAVLSSADADNPSGETLAGDEFAIRVPTFQSDKIQVTIAWTGGPANVDHWRIYRTSMPDAMPGTEDVAFTTAAASGGVTTFIDKGATLTPFVNGTPLPFGALGTWATQPSLSTPRAGAGVTVVTDETAGVSRAYLYAGFGYDSTSATPFPTTYEVLAIDPTSGAPIGTFSAPATISNGVLADTGRWLGGAYGVTPDVDSNACPSSGACQAYVFFGAGAGSVAAEMNAAGAVGSSDVALVSQGATGGALTFGLAQTANKEYGYGAVTATNYLFAIGGGSSGGTTPKLNADAITKAATATTTPTLGASWQPNGGGALPAARFLPGEAFGVPYFYTVGGTATIGGAAVATTYYDLF